MEEQANSPRSFNWKLETGNWKLRGWGFTLVEMIVVIAITGILGAVVAVFIRRPVEAYVDVSRRGELSDIADTALRRITRDLRTALPNSIRTTTVGNVRYLEYLQTSGGGRYRAETNSSGGGDILEFVLPCNPSCASFDVIGTMPALAAGNSIVIYNLSPTGGVANAYSGDNRAAYSSNSPSTITLSAATLFPFQSPGKRFQVVEGAVTYACDLATGELRRFWGYDIQSAQPTPTQASPPAGAGTAQAQLASRITGCSFTYTTNAATARTGILALNLEITQGGETVRLFQQANVSNVP